MGHKTIEQVLSRAKLALDDSDTTYFYDLLYAGEALTKVVVLGILSAVNDDQEKNRYRIEHALARADGVGDWSNALDDIVSGPCAQYLTSAAYVAQAELAKATRAGEWQYDAVSMLREAISGLNIETEEVPTKSDLKRWFRLFATLRNKTRAHGAPTPTQLSHALTPLRQSIEHVYENLCLFEQSWVHLHRNFSGKYRVSSICGDPTPFNYLKSDAGHSLQNGIYISWGGDPRRVSLMQTTQELQDFYFANGNFSARKFEFLSYYSGDRINGDSAEFNTPPGRLPPSETQATNELKAKGNCLTNAPEPNPEYINRPVLEDELVDLLLGDRRLIVTLRGRGGIGKTSLALKVLEEIYKKDRYETVVWLSARDVDLMESGPKAVRPDVVTPQDMSKLYASLIVDQKSLKDRKFDCKAFFEEQMGESDGGACLFVMDNFETTQNPIEMYTWVDTFIRSPNKILITTRLRDFKGDYWVDVQGMKREESEKLVDQTARFLGISDLLTEQYTNEVIARSEGHPYVIKMLLGEVAQSNQLRSVPHLIAGSDGVLNALFERTYLALSPCAQRAFLTLSAWQSAVPRLALEAVLLKSTEERQEVEAGIETLIQYSMAETITAPLDNQEFLSLPMVATAFGKKKLNIHPHNASIRADAEMLQLLGPSKPDDINLGLSKRLERFISTITSRNLTDDESGHYEQILEMICLNYPAGWLTLAQWYVEINTRESFEKAKLALTRFLENNPDSSQAGEAWRQLAHACYQVGDALGEVNAFIRRAQLPGVSFFDVSNSANRLNAVLKDASTQIDTDEKNDLAKRLLAVMESRRSEADADDLSRMAWLAIHLNQESKALGFVQEGLQEEPLNHHCLNLSNRLGS